MFTVLPYLQVNVAEVPSLNEDVTFGQRHSQTGRGFRRDNLDVAVQLLTSRGENDWSQHVAETAAETGLSGTNGLFEVASKTYRDKTRRAKASMDEADYASSSDDEGAALQQGRSGTQLIRSHSVLRCVSALMHLTSCCPISRALCGPHSGDSRLPAV